MSNLSLQPADGKFKSVVTEVGYAKFLNATLDGNDVYLTHMGVGDGNGEFYEPTEGMTTLVNEVYKSEIDGLKDDPLNPGVKLVDLHIPGDVEGFFVREVGLYSGDTLVGVAQYPLTHKTSLAVNASKEALIRLILLPIKGGVTPKLQVDPSIIKASRQWVEDTMALHNAADDAHGGLLAHLNAHPADPGAHKALFDELFAETRANRKHLIIDKMVDGAVDTGYPNGFIKDFSEPTDIVEAESSGYVHDPAKGVVRSINPAIDGGDVIVDWTKAELEDVKGAITAFVVDTANTSGHFDVAPGGRVSAGCRVSTSDGDVQIASISGDGTAENSVAIIGELSQESHGVSGIHGMSSDDTLALSSHHGNIVLVPHTEGTNVFSPDISKCRALLDGVTNQSYQSAGPGGDYSEVVVERHWDEGKRRIVEIHIHASNNYLIHTDWRAIGEVLNDSDEWVEFARLENQQGTAGSLHKVVALPTIGYFKAVRCRVQDSNGVAGDWQMAEIQFYEQEAVAPAGTFAAQVPLDGKNWASCASVTAVEDEDGGSIRYAVKSGSNWLGSGLTQVASGDLAALSSASGLMTSSELSALTNADFGGTFPDGIGVVLSGGLNKVPEVDTTTFDITVADQELIVTIEPQDTVALPASSPDSMLAFFGITPLVPINVATDITLFVSDDNGANYVPVTLDDYIQFVTNRYLISGVGDVAAHTGKQPKARIVAAAGKRIEVDAGGPFWR